MYATPSIPGGGGGGTDVPGGGYWQQVQALVA